jgi:hypothetical protein
MQFTRVSSEVEDAMKQSIISQLQQIATYNSNTQAAYDVVFSSLLQA